MSEPSTPTEARFEASLIWVTALGIAGLAAGGILGNRLASLIDPKDVDVFRGSALSAVASLLPWY
jgi:hypothetical protein